jgi:hypothetical protein
VEVHYVEDEVAVKLLETLERLGLMESSNMCVLNGYVVLIWHD